MSSQDSDIDVLMHVSRRLFAESREEFRAAHRMGIESLDATTADEHLKLFGEALRRERRAFEIQREAIELQRAAFDMRAESWAKLKAARGW